MTTLTVGTGEQYSTIAAAVGAAQDGDTVLVNAGTYVNDFIDITHKITLESTGGLAVIEATTQPSNGKGAIVTDADATIVGFGVTGVTVGDGNGAGIRYDGGQLTVEDSVFWNDQDGILANADPNGNIVIDHSEFGFNGAGDGYTHNIYINDVNSLTVENSYFHDSQVGHEIKSRASNTTIVDNRIQDNQGDGSYDIDLPDGGNAVIQGNVIEKGVNAENWYSIHYGGEGTPYSNSALSITGNTLVNDNPNGVLVLNQTSVTASLTGNSIYGYGSASIANGPVAQSGNVTLATKPTLDMSTTIPAGIAAPPVITGGSNTGPVDLSLSTPYEAFGPQGAVAASGRVLTVGAGGEFASLGAALEASTDGDTIQVAAGTYVNDGGTVNHKVVIEGVGGIARFMNQNALNDTSAILTVNTDATIENMEFTGEMTNNGHIPAVAVNGGNVTLDNDLVDASDTGLVAFDNPATTLSIYNSEIAWNGNNARGTNNMTVGAVGSLTMVGDYVHGGYSGHEIVDEAFNTDIENTRVIDGAGVGASFLVDLGRGGNAVLKNDVLVKGPDAANGVLVHVGNEGTAWANSNVSITGTSLVSQYVNSGHPYTYFIYDNDESAPIAVDGSNDTFVGGVAGSGELWGPGITGSNDVTATSVPIDVSSPVSGSLAPAVTFGAGAASEGLLYWTDTSNSASGVNNFASPDANGPSYLQHKFIWSSGDSVAMATSTPNSYIKTGAGNDALSVTSGNNVLDGGAGSNFLTGGTGNDTFYIDARSNQEVWTTVRNFHAGDAATLWGFMPGVSKYSWDSTVSGATGYEGATLRGDVTGTGSKASFTFTGLSVQQAQGLIITSGTAGGLPYLMVYNPGV